MSDPTSALSAQRYGPWADGLAAEERGARFRELHALGFLLLSPWHPLVAALRDAANDPGADDAAWLLLQALEARPKRRLLCTFARLREAPR